MCWVMPPASPAATRAWRMRSSNEVLPWSTWPMTVTTGARGKDSDLVAESSSSVKASGSSRAATMALWPISSTTIMAVSWSKGWLMVTIWPSFINCLMTSEALIAILCANSATVMVSGTWTSMMRCSTGAEAWGWSSRSRSRLRARGPPRQLLRPTPVLLSPRVLISFFLLWSSAQLEDSLALLSSFCPSLGAVASVPAGLAAAGLTVPTAGLCKVPFLAPAASAGLGSSGFFATKTRLGAFIMVRMASASAKALLRRSSLDLLASKAVSAACWAFSAAVKATGAAGTAASTNGSMGAWVAGSATVS